MDFHQRLEKAIERGHRAANQRAREELEQALTEEDYKRLHSQYRLDLAEHIETCLKQLPQYFPGFQFKSLVDERGWGGVVSRDDIGRGRSPFFSRLEVVVRPFSSVHVLEVAAKGAVRNKELFQRSHYQKLQDVDRDVFHDLVDHWVVEFAEIYSANS